MTRDLAAHIRITDRTNGSPVILHAPHASTFVPPPHRTSFTIPDDELRLEISRLTDHATDRIVERVPGVSMVVHGLSRLVVDVERFDGDDEEMNGVGMGVLYTHSSQRQRIRRLRDGEREPLLAYYRGYGERFADLVDRALERHGRALILDVHSYPAAALPYELHQADRRPELCIGVDESHTPPGLVRTIRTAFAGWNIEVNQPFSGTYVPTRHFGDGRVSSAMLEIRRDMYLTRDGAVADARVDEIAERIRRTVTETSTGQPSAVARSAAQGHWARVNSSSDGRRPSGRE